MTADLPGPTVAIAVVLAAARDLPGVEAKPMWFTMDERLVDTRVNCAALSASRPRST